MGESSTIEFKTEDAHNDSIAKEVVAFANFLGGKVLVGVGDVGRVLGVSDRKIEQRIVQINQGIDDDFQGMGHTVYFSPNYKIALTKME